MIVALDLGNTRIKWAVHPGGLPVAGRMLADGAVDSAGVDALPDCWAAWGRPDEIAACSVAGSAADAALERLAGRLAVPLRRIRPLALAAGVSNLYGNPASLGADRWAALAGARARNCGAALVVDAGTAMEFDGSIDDYIAFVLAKDPAPARNGGEHDNDNRKVNKKDQRKAAAAARDKGQAMRKRATAAEAELDKLTAQLKAVDHAMFDPKAAEAALAKLTMTELMKRRAELEVSIAAAEAAWLEASEALEALVA